METLIFSFQAEGPFSRKRLIVSLPVTTSRVTEDTLSPYFLEIMYLDKEGAFSGERA